MSNILFCDTNILRYVLDDASRVSPFLQHIKDGKYVLAISLIQVIELFKIPRYHLPLASLIIKTDAHGFSWWKEIVSSEVRVYPNTDGVDPLAYPSFGSSYTGPLAKSLLACKIRSMSSTDSGACRPLIPEHAVH
jgi:hypothetical protein